MAPQTSSRTQGPSERPLADFFWIAGLDGQEILDAYKWVKNTEGSPDLVAEPLHLGVDAPIEEEWTTRNGHVAEAFSILESPITTHGHSRQGSFQRLSRLSNEARSSIQSLDRLTHLSSTRSRATVRRVTSSEQPSPGLSKPHREPSGPAEPTLLSDADFEKALNDFNTDRDAFLLDLDSASRGVKHAPGEVQQTRRTQKIVAEDLETLPSRALGSVRRHMSFRDMNSVKRQPSIARRVSTRTSRRMSSYNSVMSTPEPFQVSANAHPLRRSFPPALLDRYPRPNMVSELKNRVTFPDYVPMFAFPNDVQIASADARPPSTWHEFSMTAADNTKVSGLCVIVWIPLGRKTADEIEKRCEEWRKANLTDAERELAASLGERLASERAKLSQLLALLPTAESGTLAREQREDEIGTVEERIALMSDMLKPLRHGAASRIEGLTDGDTGLWIPRAYGILGRDQAMTPVWKEWLKAVVVPMMDGAILRVPASSPRVGMWQPLEKYVRRICCETPLPTSSRTQVEVGVRELRLYARKEAVNELPQSRSSDLYPLFRSLTIPNIVLLFEYLCAESRIILVSSHIAMLKLVSKALLDLMWPLEWAGVYVPVVPSRLTQVLEAPCPYICGIVRRSERFGLPEDDDFVMVDLDKDELHATAHPPSLPKQMRKKLMSLLHFAAPLHHSCGVPVGPPRYAVETFPNNSFVSESSSLFVSSVRSTGLSRYATLSSAQFGAGFSGDLFRRGPVLNAFMQATLTSSRSERPITASTLRRPSMPDSDRSSPITTNLPPLPGTPQSRNDSGYGLKTSLREERSGHFDSWSKRSPSTSQVRRKASLPFVRHHPSPSTASQFAPTESSVHAPSTYARSTLAASTIMPGMTVQPARNTEGTSWVEGHCLEWRRSETAVTCTVCEEKAEDGCYRCAHCPLMAHSRCATLISIFCPAAFCPDQVRAAFARFFASLFYTYRTFSKPVAGTEKQARAGLASKIDVDMWIRSLSPDHASYLEMLRQTQSFDEFLTVREVKDPPHGEQIALFDALIAAKRGRSKGVRSSIGLSLSGRNPFSRRSVAGGTPAQFLLDTSTHVWKTVSAPTGSDRPSLMVDTKGRDYRTIVTRTPAKLEDEFLVTDAVTKHTKHTKLDKSDRVPNGRLRLNGLKMNAP